MYNNRKDILLMAKNIEAIKNEITRAAIDLQFFTFAFGKKCPGFRFRRFEKNL